MRPYSNRPAHLNEFAHLRGPHATCSTLPLEETTKVAVLARTMNRPALLVLWAFAAGCGASQTRSDCVPIPPPEAPARCTQDAECRTLPPLPVTCGEAKCFEGICRFRAPLTTDCPCMPGEMRACLLPSRDHGIQMCKNSGGIPTWDACRAICPSG